MTAIGVSDRIHLAVWVAPQGASRITLAHSGCAAYIPFNSGASASTPDAPPESFTGRAPVFLCLNAT